MCYLQPKIPQKISKYLGVCKSDEAGRLLKTSAGERQNWKGLGYTEWTGNILGFTLKVGLHFNTPTLFRSIGNKELPKALSHLSLNVGMAS